MLSSLAKGKEAEDKLMDFLKAINGNPQYNSDQRNVQYDVKCLNSGLTFEVKNDIMSSRTGNVALEYWNSKSVKKSGINLTEADFWVHFTKSKGYINTVLSVKSFVSRHKPLKVIKGGGDKNADLIIYTIGDFLNEMYEFDYFKTIDELSSHCSNDKLLYGGLAFQSEFLL
jgi:hypothetical protein